MSVLFDFNASLDDAAPVNPMLLSVDLMRMRKSGLLMNAICVLFLLYLLLKLRWVSVALDFNASLSDVAPLLPILFPVDLMRMKKSELLMDAICMLFFFCFHYPNRVL